MRCRLAIAIAMSVVVAVVVLLWPLMLAGIAGRSARSGRGRRMTLRMRM
jgi:hypothetical protein